ncbi:MAG TPA: ATPase, T2SS/T4P/T4SS family [Candidatus Dormibacteraeota bacterium]|nr:ATPase, T2SS/T4P/T4SS family [Candidatus Dormibacteraeota bacterium]HVS49761.1 ATPase, T2SS/T4P/T4SS family [Candidatus Dormibacteraeota bacterium]
MQAVDASPDQVRQAEAHILPAFRKSLDEVLRDRQDPRPVPADDRTIFGLADKAVRDYHAATARSASLPQLSQVQYWEIRQRMYVSHGALGPLGELLAIDGVEDIHIDGADGGYLEYGDHREPLPVAYGSEDELVTLVRFYAEQAGKHFDLANPIVTITLRDGSRLNAILPPVAKPLAITIRKQQLRRFLYLDDMARAGTLPFAMIPLLDAAVRARLNIILSGPTGTGKTTLARVLALMIPDGERTCVLETETELWLHELRRGFISLEERDANVEGAGRITLQDLFQRGALRQRPRRIIVGEVRGKEAMDMLHAMTSGHDGSLTTLHASGPRMALSRLEVLAMSGDANLAPHVVRQMVGSGVDLVVHLSTFHRGDDEVRRLASLAFVAENPEDPLGSPIVSEAAVYRIADDSWEWRPDALMHMPDKIWRKLLVAGIDPEGLVRQVLSDGRG